MYTPHSVTLYIVTENDDFTQNIDTTVLEGVFLDSSNGANVNNSGANNANSATLYIPFSVKATDLYGNEKVFVDAKTYRAMQNPAGYWTMDKSGKSSVADCYFIKGAVYRTMEYREAKEQHEDVYTINRVRTLDFGSKDMQHWQVSAE